MRLGKAAAMLVLSAQSGKVYDVDVLGGCICPAYRFRPWKACKHMKALSEHNRTAAEKKVVT